MGGRNQINKGIDAFLKAPKTKLRCDKCSLEMNTRLYTPGEKPVHKDCGGIFQVVN